MRASVTQNAGGYIDYWGETGDPGRSIICGWVGNPWREFATENNLRVEASATAGLVQCGAAGLIFSRADVAAIGVGIIFLCDAPAEALAGIEHLDLIAQEQLCRIRTGRGTQRLSAEAMRATVRPLVLRALPVDHRTLALASLDLAGESYHGPSGPVLSVEAALACQGAGMLVIGSLTAADTNVASAAVVSDGAAHKIEPSRIVTGAPAPMGEALRVSLAVRIDPPADNAWLDVTLAGGGTGRTALPPAAPAGRGTLLKALAAVDAEADIDRLFDEVMGPAIGALWAAFTGQPVQISELAFGAAPAKPQASLIIPLHGRIDFLEVQLALFSGQACMAGTEIMFVVDDPGRQAEARSLASSAWARFGVPFRLLQPSRNMGFAAASNAGLRAARAAIVCFMNSDVFPDTPDWLSRLSGHLARDGSLGLVAPMLLFADGSVQHRGMELISMPQFAGWRFPRHTAKGMRPDGQGLVRVEAVTGACILMRRALAEKLQGFDEAFVIGDFEDSDLCLRAARAGFGAAVDLDVRALHLERQSQGAEAPWRMGATLYNAWVHQRRWFGAPSPAPRRRRG